MVQVCKLLKKMDLHNAVAIILPHLTLIIEVYIDTPEYLDCITNWGQFKLALKLCSYHNSGTALL
jgi:hypothetical protein